MKSLSGTHTPLIRRIGFTCWRSNGGDDAFGGTRRKNIIIDHCSVSWSTDEAFSVYSGDSTTLQWNLIAEPLNYSYHFETGDKDYEHHGYGGIWGGRHLSAHHNLFAHCNMQGGFPHGTGYEATVNAWPALKSEPAAPDKDQDGMPDAWETKHALNPADAGDAGGYTLDKQYTNIEVYLNELVK